jgi:hypothetical protein
VAFWRFDNAFLAARSLPLASHAIPCTERLDANKIEFPEETHYKDGTVDWDSAAKLTIFSPIASFVVLYWEQPY